MNEYGTPKNKLFEQMCSKAVLLEAFGMVWKNKGAPEIDKVSITMFKQKLEGNLDELSNELRNRKYNPKPVRAVEIPKANGGVRHLGIPTVRDRIVQAAIKLLIEPILEPTFSTNSYGFRPGKNQQQAIKKAQEIAASGKEFVIDIDLADFFNTINHDRLIARLSQYIEDKRILRLIGMTLRSGIMHNGLTQQTREGTTQGSPLSPILSNVVLDELDKELEVRKLEFCRFAGDANIFVKTRKSAERVMTSISKFIQNRLKLKFNQEKSKIAKTDKVKFLGMTIIAGTIAISLISMNRANAKVKELTPRGTSLTLEQTTRKISKWCQGWSAYYAMTNYPAQLRKIEAHTRRRLRTRTIKQQKKRRNIFNFFIKRGVSKERARVAFSNKKWWSLSCTHAAHLAMPNKWFTEKMKMKVRTTERREHWFAINKWVKLT